MTDNYGDFAASLVMRPVAAVKLCSFLNAKANKGPYKVESYAGRPKELITAAQIFHSIWQSRTEGEKRKLTADHAVQGAISKHRAENESYAMVKARAVAKAALGKKRAARAEKLA